MTPIITRFRAYQLGTAGASYSYFDGTHFTLLEGRLTELSESRLRHEMERCGVDRIHTLHITSWDLDHCCAGDLERILYEFGPSRVEYPGYPPHTENAKECLKHITEYRNSPRKNFDRQCISISPEYIAGLGSASRLAFRPIMYHPKGDLGTSSNDNSTVKLFRTGSFNVASLGDIEHQNIAAGLRRCKIFQRETDVLLLAHHGSDCYANGTSFLEKVRPAVAVCASNYDNQHDHPHPDVRERLHDLGIKLCTTKTGDVLIRSIAPHEGQYQVVNFKADSGEVSSRTNFVSKKSKLLSMNEDTIRQLYAPRPSHPRS
jgi:competence protein ComEC